jgi:hypothetical protein
MADPIPAFAFPFAIARNSLSTTLVSCITSEIFPAIATCSGVRYAHAPIPLSPR